MDARLLEEALKHIPNAQILVNIVSQRVRQLSQGQRSMLESGARLSFSDTALTEIIEGKITSDTGSNTDSIFSIHIDPGDASVETLTELLEALSDYYEALSGSPLIFVSDGEFTQAAQLAFA